MGQQIVVSAVAQGSARNYDIHQLFGSNFQSCYAVRDGSGLSGGSLFFGNNTSDWGTGGSHSPGNVLVDGTPAFQISGGCQEINPALPWVVTRPLNRFTWPRGKHRFEMFMAWPTPTLTAGVENGMFLTQIDFGLIVSATDLGIGISNDGGTVKYYSRSPGLGLDSAPIALAGSLTHFNKFAIILHNATKDQDARFDIEVNDRLILTRTNAQLQYTGIFWFLGLLGIKDALHNLQYSQCSYMAGPDTDIGV